MTAKIPAVGFISLGCAKNLVDTERLSSALVALGYRIEPEYQNCDAVVVNTCGFIDPAVEESLDAIGEALEHAPKVIVTGCLGARAQTILERFPNVTAVYGPGMRASVLRGIREAIGVPPAQARQQVRSSGILLTPPHYAYLKIAEGCRHRCSFCIIPSLRGPLRSRRPGTILKEAEDLAARGVKELLVIAQDSSDYGIDLSPKESLTNLCRALSGLNLWLRVHYVYPGPEADRLAGLMGEGLVLPYLDAPLQHVSPGILKNMRRPGGFEQALKMVERWRAICPDLSIRSTFITGFPGESETEFNELLDFIREAKLDRVGCFAYSDVAGAAANDLPGAVDPDLRQERCEMLMDAQAQVSYEKLEQRMGREYLMLIDDVTEDGVAVGRSKYEAPDVDGVITVENAGHLRPGDFCRVKITGHDEHDLAGELVSSGSFGIGFKSV